MNDKKYKNLHPGQKVFFCINRNSWTGKIIGVDNQNEQCLIEVTERKTGVGKRERLNKIECERYITIID